MRLFFLLILFLRLKNNFCAHFIFILRLKLLQMNNSARFSCSPPVFHKFHTPETAHVTGYAAIVHKLKLSMPMVQPIALVSEKNKRYSTEAFTVFPNRYKLDDVDETNELKALYLHLVFALKYEGVNLLVFKKVAEHYSKQNLEELISFEPTGKYSRRIWFLLEWLLEEELNNDSNLSKKSYVDCIDTKLQYAIKGDKSRRHRVINNIPGSLGFAPMIRKTEVLENLITENYGEKKNVFLRSVHKDVLQRASAYLLLKDSKASFDIEGEKPRNNRAVRWGQAIGQAGLNELNENEIIRLQELVINNKKFLKIGIRAQEGFIGDRDRITQEPIPEHISAKYQNLESLMSGWYLTSKKLLESEIDPVLVAAKLAFGFVFIHPLVDGNGRIHRFIVHDTLARMNYTEQGMIFPVSSSILSHIRDYQNALSSYSIPILDFIEWETSTDKNVKVLNETKDFYRYFDATKQAEFLYECVKDTIENIIPEEVGYLRKYDEFKTYLDEVFEMPDNMVSLLISFLEQGNGKLSKRAIGKEFSMLNDDEVEDIQNEFKKIFSLQ